MNLHSINNSSLLRDNYSVNTYVASVLLTASQTTQVPSVEPMIHHLISLPTQISFGFDDDAIAGTLQKQMISIVIFYQRTQKQRHIQCAEITTGRYSDGNHSLP